MSDKKRLFNEGYQPTGITVNSGLQPIKNTLNPANPPKGGSGVPPKNSESGPSRESAQEKN